MALVISTPDSFQAMRGINPRSSTNKNPMSGDYARNARLRLPVHASESAKGFARPKPNFRQFFAQSLVCTSNSGHRGVFLAQLVVFSCSSIA